MTSFLHNLANNLAEYLHNVARYGWWRVLTELFLIGLVAYWLVRFLRGTPGARMLKGTIFVLIGLYLLVRLIASSSTFDLQRIDFLYKGFLQFAILAIVVVFQPELRRALMRLGETRLFRSWTTQVDEEIEALVESATFLSRRKIGAVIAIERDVGLGGISESGTHLNAEISAALLDTIFWPNSPLHDLGVVISQGASPMPACSSPWPRAASWTASSAAATAPPSA